MSEIQKLLPIAERLLERTDADAVGWAETDSPDVFIASLQSGVVAVGRTTRPAHGYFFAVRNDFGVTLEEASIGDPEEEMFLPSSLKRIFQETLVDLYERARRKALEVDSTLDSLLDELS